MGPRTDRRHQQGEESRQRILDATIDIAAERGYEGTSISLVSKHSGLPASSIYWHFASKDELLAAVIDRSFNRWVVSLPTWDPPPAGVSLADHVRVTWRETSDSLQRNEDFLRLGLMLSLERRPLEPTARTRFLESRALALERLSDWFRGALDWAGVEPDPQLCRTLASLHLAFADGLFIEKQVSSDAVRTGELFDFTSNLFSEVIELLAARVAAAVAVPATRRRARPRRDLSPDKT
jgi:AcrR family transcriptional regulator